MSIKPEEASNTTINQSEDIHVRYASPKLYRRVFALFLDYIIFALLWIALFLGIRAIVNMSSAYKNAESNINKTRLECGLYVSYNNETVTLGTYYKGMAGEYTNKQVYEGYVNGLNNFYKYLNDNISPEASKSAQEDFYTKIKSKNYVYSSVNYFIFDETNKTVTKNPDCQAPYSKYSEVYLDYIDNVAYGLLSQFNSNYLNSTRILSNFLLFLEVPLATFLSGVVTFYIPGLIFRRGRQTIGMLVYKMGRTNSSLLHLSFARFTARSAIYIIFIQLLSIFTFGLPLIISFSMMAFSKNRQNFVDYMLGIYDVELYNTKVYYTKEEILIEELEKKNKHVEFQAESRL